MIVSRVRPGHPFRAADRIALDQAVDDLDAAGERYTVHFKILFQDPVVCSIVDIHRIVNENAYMDFRKATDDLCDGIPHQELAKALGVSVATVRQARLRPDAKAHRSPPGNWERAVIKLAGEQIQRYRRLISEMTGAQQSSLITDPSGSGKSA